MNAGQQCAGCEKPIGETLGGVAGGKDGSLVWFHNEPSCIMKASQYAIMQHSTEMKRIGKELQHGKDKGINQKLAEYKPNVAGSYEY